MKQTFLFLNMPMYQIINYFKDPIKKFSLLVPTFVTKKKKKQQLPLIMYIKHEFSSD